MKSIFKGRAGFTCLFLSVVVFLFCYASFDFLDTVDGTPSKYPDRITVLTSPIGETGNWYHPAVTGSLLRGLESLKVDYNYNPRDVDEVGSTVVVLTNKNVLKQAIKWKRAGKIKKLLAGPNHVDAPHDSRGIILSKELDMYLLPGKFVKVHFLEDAPQMNIGIWPAGVDTSYWKPDVKLDKKRTKNVLVYWKTESEEFCEMVEQTLREYGWNPVRITYGSYDHTSYKKTLEECLFGVYISRSETQGIALVEGWSMDVPTLVWDPCESWRTGKFTYRNRRYSEVSSCPYLNKSTGQRWETIDEFKALLASLEESIDQFSPRSWVIENMSDTASSEILISLIESIDSATSK